MENGNGGVPPKEDNKFDVSLLEKLQTDPTSVTPEEAKLISENSKALFAQKNHWKEKATDPETGKSFKDLLSEKKDEPIKPQPTEGLNEIKEDVGKLKQSEEKRSFGHSKNLSPEETDEVFAYATGMGISAKDALEKPFVKAAIEATRTQKRAESNIPGASNRAPRVDGKTWNDMDDKEKRKNFGEVVSSFKR